MKEVRIMLDFMYGPIAKNFNLETRQMETGIDIIDNDPILRELDEKAQDMFSSYYEFDSHDMACWFNEEQRKKDKPKMLALLKQINERLAEINDGSFVVEDEETEIWENL